MKKMIAQGAEAKIYLEKDKVIKDRIKKSYRLEDLDNSIRKKRTKSEGKILNKAAGIINVPKVIEIKENIIILEEVKGKKLSEHLNKLKNKFDIANLIGESVGKIHDESIIHGDLTTSNMILKKDKVFFIDFGLGYISHKLEDKAVDLHLLKQALEAKHHKFFDNLWKNIEEGYKNSKESKKVLERLIAVERRGRYKKGS